MEAKSSEFNAEVNPFRLRPAFAGLGIAAMLSLLFVPAMYAGTLHLTAYAKDGHALSGLGLLGFITPASLKGKNTSGLTVTDLAGNPVPDYDWKESLSTPVISWSGAQRIALMLPWPVSGDAFTLVVLDKNGRGYTDGESVNLNEEVALAEYRLFQSHPSSKQVSLELRNAIASAKTASSPPERAALFDKILAKIAAAENPNTLCETVLLDKAKEQPLLNIYTNHLSYGPILIEGFLKRYPFVKINHQDFGPLDGINEPYVSAEKFMTMDPNSRPDVMVRGEIFNVLEYLNAGVYARLDDLPNWSRRPRLTKDDPRYGRFLGNLVVLIYNKHMVKFADIPKTLDELTQPRWKDKVVLRNPMKGQSGAFLAEFINSTRGNLDWYRALARNGAHLSEKGGEVFSKLFREEVPIGVFRDVEYFNLMNLFKNRKYIGVMAMYPIEKETPYQFHFGIVNTFAPHPYAARLFMNWVLSDDARNELEKAGFSAGRRQLEDLKRPGVWYLNDPPAIAENARRVEEINAKHDDRIKEVVRIMCEEHVKLDKGSTTCTSIGRSK